MNSTPAPGSCGARAHWCAFRRSRPRCWARLIERAGEVVSREELREALWGADTFVDFERGLNFCMSQVRSALKDDSSNPIYIRTIPRQGYQFIAPLERVSTPEEEEKDSASN